MPLCPYPNLGPMHRTKIQNFFVDLVHLLSNGDLHAVIYRRKPSDWIRKSKEKYCPSCRLEMKGKHADQMRRRGHRRPHKPMGCSNDVGNETNFKFTAPPPPPKCHDWSSVSTPPSQPAPNSVPVPQDPGCASTPITVCPMQCFKSPLALVQRLSWLQSGAEHFKFVASLLSAPVCRTLLPWPLDSSPSFGLLSSRLGGMFARHHFQPPPLPSS